MAGALDSDQVRDRLVGTPGIHKLPIETFDVFLMRDFLDPAQCEQLIALIDADRQPSGLLIPSDDPDFRTSETANLSRRLPLVAQIERDLDTLFGIPAAFGESLQGQRYAVGQQFKPHHDFFHPGQPYWNDQQRVGGQRTWTAMIFLNVPERGGQTFFPMVGLKVSPRLGNLLLWENVDRTGCLNYRSLHQGLPVEAGVKYVLTKWYRERPWTPHLARGAASPAHIAGPAYVPS